MAKSRHILDHAGSARLWILKIQIRLPLLGITAITLSYNPILFQARKVRTAN